MRIGLFPGTFDPITTGHIDIVSRSAKLFDKVIVAIGINPKKATLFDLEQRLSWIKRAFKDQENIEVETYETLTTEFAKAKNAKFIIRGVRNGNDLEYERNIAHINKKIAGDIDTFFLLTSLELSYVSSTLVREIYSYDGNLEGLVPDFIIEDLEKVKKN